MEEIMLSGRKADWFSENGAKNTVREIMQQPRLWHTLADRLTAKAEEICAFMKPVLAIPGLRIVWTGAGSSAFVGECVQKLLTLELGLPGEAVPSPDIVATPDIALQDVPTLIVSFARSGDSPESVACLKQAVQSVREVYQLVLVCNENSALTRYARADERTLMLCMPPEACDAGFAMTSSVSCMALAAWCVFAPEKIEERANMLHLLAQSVGGELTAFDELAYKIAQTNYTRLVYLGSGALHGLAQEGAVKSMELTDGLVAAAYDTPMSFRHGPKTIVNDETMTIHFLSSVPQTRRYDLDVVCEMAREKGGNRIVVIAGEALADNTGLDAVLCYEEPVGVNRELCAYIKGLVFLQLLSLEKSLERGFPPDTPSQKGDVNRVVRGVIIYET